MKLSGVRVLDLSRFLPGPYLTMLMADHGAEVLKIESHQGEPTRRLGPPVAGHPIYFRNTQRGKLSLILNLKHDEGREIFLRLAAQSDVLVESFRPGVMDRLGLGYQAVQERAPSIIYCSLSAFGQTGPLSQRPSHDLGAQALTGVLSLSQASGSAPSAVSSPRQRRGMVDTNGDCCVLPVAAAVGVCICRPRHSPWTAVSAYALPIGSSARIDSHGPYGKSEPSSSSWAPAGTRRLPQRRLRPALKACRDERTTGWGRSYREQRHDIMGVCACGWTP